ncbi:MAG: hypothetical protein AAB393_10030, partial [Bacteroidota bacterium]
VSGLWVTMTVEAGFELPNNEDFNNAVTFTTDSFLVNGTRSISNLDLDRTIQLKSYRVDNTAKRRLEESALPTGQIPAGTYTFNIRVTSTDGTVSATPLTPIVIVLSNPTTIDLISPIDGDQFVGQFPLFQWQYDGPSSRISIYEKLPGQTTLEEAASGVPHYSGVTSTRSLQYPASGTRILEPGKSYVWFVEGLIGASGGTQVGRKSTLRSFTVTSNGGASFASILDELSRALPQYQALFDELRAQGFTTASTVRFNGSAVSLSEVLRLVNTLRQNPDAVSSVEIE